MIENNALGRKPSETLRRVARYYYDKGNGTRKVRAYLERFIVSCSPTASIPKWANAIETAIKFAKKRKAIKIEYISISVAEMSEIDKLPSAPERRLAFTLLCLAKYWDIVSGSHNHWVNSKDSEIMCMANIHDTSRAQSVMYHDMMEKGMIRFARRVDNTNVQIFFISEGEEAIRISDFRNLGYQYEMYHNPKKFYKCEKCGLTLRRRGSGRPAKYCSDCAVAVQLTQKMEYVMRKQKQSVNGKQK